jgi:hypothetical protein
LEKHCQRVEVTFSQVRRKGGVSKFEKKDIFPQLFAGGARGSLVGQEMILNEGGESDWGQACLSIDVKKISRDVMPE